MTEMRRLMDGGDSNEFERWLLRSAADERPTSILTSQMRAGLGLPTASIAARTSSISTLKLTLLAVSVGALIGVHGTEMPQRQLPNTAPPWVAVAVNDSLGSSTESTDSVLAPTSAPADTVQKLAPLIPPDSRSTSKGTKPSRFKVHLVISERNRAANGPDLREEIRLLDLARNAIQSRLPEVALGSLDTYANRFAAGAFKQEASVLRMQALAQRGDLGRASSMAKQFVESNPSSPYVNRAARIAKSSNVADTAP